jgi:membrane protease YdiL (CAAX protease family)
MAGFQNFTVLEATVLWAMMAVVSLAYWFAFRYKSATRVTPGFPGFSATEIGGAGIAFLITVVAAVGYWAASIAAALAAVPGQYSVTFAGFNSSIVLLWALIYCLPIAVCEELVFRGFLLRYLQFVMNIRLALVLQAIAFGCLHVWRRELSVWAFLALVVFGWALGLLAFRTRTLMFSIVAHTAWNWTLMGLVTSKNRGETYYGFLKFDSSGTLKAGTSAYLIQQVVGFVLVVGLTLLLWAALRRLNIGANRNLSSAEEQRRDPTSETS